MAVSLQLSSASQRQPPAVPRLSLEVPRRERSEALDIKLQDLMAYWESWSYLSGDSSRTSRTWERGHPLDLNDEFIHEDPNYDEEKVNREALRDYLKETGLSYSSDASWQAASRNHGSSAVEDSDGGTAEVERRPPRGRPKQRSKGEATFKKPREVRSRTNTFRQSLEFKTSSGNNSSEDGESDNSTKKKKPLGSVARGRQDKATKKRQTSADKNNRMDVSKQKVPKHNPSVHQPTTAARAKRGRARDSGELKVAGIQGKFSVQKKIPPSPVEQQPSGSQPGEEARREEAELGAGDGAAFGFQPGPGSAAGLATAFGRESSEDE